MSTVLPLPVPKTPPEPATPAARFSLVPMARSPSRRGSFLGDGTESPTLHVQQGRVGGAVRIHGVVVGRAPLLE